jgi:methylmalonyl-CoA/ethylmalonyl-CoA epimerase
MINAKAVNHVGIAVESIDRLRLFYEQCLGATFEAIEEVPSQNVRVAFFKLGDVRLELLEATDPASPITKFLAKRGAGLHHIAFTVSDIEERLAELKAAGIQLIDAAPRPGAHGTRVAFVHPKSAGGVLTELCEPRG